MISARLIYVPQFNNTLTAPEAWLWLETLGAKGVRAIHYFVDSGSPITLIPDAIANANHIPWTRKHKRYYSAPGGVNFGYLAEVTFRICAVEQGVPCLIYPITSGFRRTILGTAGIFDRFKISFPLGHVQIEPH